MFKLSGFCHYFLIDNRLILFHALNFEQVVIDIPNISIDMGKDISELLSELDQDKIEEMLQKEMLVNDYKDDQVFLDSCRNYIQKPYITTAYFFLTNDCNLACKYCFEKQSVPDLFKKEKMTSEVFHKGLDFFVKLINRDSAKFQQKKTIIFYGGEPFYNKKVLFYAIRTIREYVRTNLLPKETYIIVVTNGTLLNQQDVVFLKEHNITLTFSVDGNKAATQNRVFPNNEPAFDHITSKYIMCRNAGLNINIACTLTPETIEHFKESMDFFINEMKITNIGFNALLDNGIIKIPADYNQKAAQFVVDAYRELSKHNIRENRMARRLNVFNHKKPCVFDCNAQGGRQIAIAPKGEVGICHEHIADRKHFVTSIYDEFIPEENSTYLEWNKRSPLYMEKCYSCPAIGLCGGGCVINSENENKTIWEPDERFCEQTISILKFIIYSIHKTT